MERVLSLDSYASAGIGVLALLLGLFFTRKIPFLKRFCIPAPVSGGLLISLITLLLFSVFGVECRFDGTVKDLCMMLFFTAVGFQCDVTVLKKGGKPLLVMIGLVAVLIITQNFISVGIAKGLHLPTGKLSYCNAGHLPPILVKDGRCSWLDLKETNTLLGIDGDFHFCEEHATIAHGEQIIIYTDGVTEAANARNELLGFDHLLERMQTCQQPVDDRTVYDIVCHFSSGAEQADDIAIMSITRK